MNSRTDTRRNPTWSFVYSLYFPCPPPTLLTLATAVGAVLVGWSRRRTTVQDFTLRARIVPASAERLTVLNAAIGHALAVHRQAGRLWREGVRSQGLAGLSDVPRPGAPRTNTDADLECVLARTLKSAPPNATHWSTRTLAQATGLRQTAVSRIWRASALQPHRTETFKLSCVSEFIGKVRNVIGLYLHPPTRALVLSVDEKS